MSSSNDIFNLPVAPDELCFDKNEFKKKSFSVDEFLHTHRNAAGLEQMRDDLGVYLKVLRSAMIELINEDYVDFVNLSSNLIGLDTSIDGIQSALGQLKDEILSVKMTLTDTMTELSNCLQEKRLLKDHLNSVRCVAKVRSAITKLENLFSKNLTDTNEINPVILERAAFEIIQLEFDMQFCSNLIDRNHGRDRVEELNKILMTKLKEYFLLTFNQNNSDNLQRSLRIYCTLEQCTAAEEIVRTEIVGPQMFTIISETTLQNSPQGLSGIYEQILNFIRIKMKQLLELTKEGGKIKGFDFAVNSFWTEVERRLETHMSSIFAPGNPDMFYQKYKCTTDFLNQFSEILCSPNHVAKWRSHQQYKSFQTRWNLPVYFQIRFQEIGGLLEKSCNIPIDQNLIQSGGKFNLTPFTTLWLCLNKCWSPGIYLQEIFIRFWTLTLQQLARITIWIDECLNVENWPSSTTTTHGLIDFYVYLHLNTKTLINELPKFLAHIYENCPPSIESHKNLLDQCFTESSSALEMKLEKIEMSIGKEILDQSNGFIRQVNDIPRLYRKTNKEIPSKPCPYVQQILEASKQFNIEHGGKFEKDVLRSFFAKIFSTLNTQYCSAVEDVLTSVQKTEESLRRLKNLREKSLPSSSSSERLGISDDDKIRLQLYVDVMYWTEEIETIGVPRNGIDHLAKLIALVEDAAKLRSVDEK